MNVGWVVGVPASILIFLIGLYFVLNPERKELNEIVRARLGGSYVHLSKGMTHYALEGPADGPVVVLIHGGITPLVTWDEHVPALTRAGYRVLRYDHYGRGYSDRPYTGYDRALYRRQLLDLLDSLSLCEPVDLVGYSHGGGIAVNFAARYPKRILKIALIAPIVHSFSLRPLLNPPVIGEFFARVTALREAPNLVKASIRDTSPDKRRARLLFEQTTYKGFQRSLLSMARTDAISGYLDDYRALGKQTCEVLLIRGERDSETTQEAIEAVCKLVPQTEFHTIPENTHEVVFESPGLVCALLVAFLKGRNRCW